MDGGIHIHTMADIILQTTNIEQMILVRLEITPELEIQAGAGICLLPVTEIHN